MSSSCGGIIFVCLLVGTSYQPSRRIDENLLLPGPTCPLSLKPTTVLYGESFSITLLESPYIPPVDSTCILFQPLTFVATLKPVGLPRWCWWQNLPANTGDRKDAGSIPGGGMATHSGILACRIAWTEEAWWSTVIRGEKGQTRLRQLAHMRKGLQFPKDCSHSKNLNSGVLLVLQPVFYLTYLTFTLNIYSTILGNLDLHFTN